jgi:thiamine-phosphate diphosphorylase
VSARRAPPPLVAITPGTASPGGVGELERRVAAALQGGLAGLLVRESELEDGPFAELALRLRARAPDLWIALHDRPHLALATGADAVHLGWRSLAPLEVRPWLDPGIAIGLSTHAEDPGERWAGADYLFHGPVYATAKPGPLGPGAKAPIGPGAKAPIGTGARAPIGLDGLAEGVRRAAVPVLGLGGITPARVAEVRASGAAGVAVLSGLLAAGDPAARAAEYLAALAS